MTAPTLLTLQSLSVGYGQRAVLSDLHATLNAGELVCVLGPNGAGKSTLLRTIAGLQKPLSGSVRLGNDDLHHLSASALAQRLAIVLTERVEVDHLRVYDLVALGRQPHTHWLGNLSANDHRTIQTALDATHTSGLAQRLVMQLSDGERQRVMVARALAQEPHILLLDEPTAFLDLPRRVEIMLLLRQLARETQRAFLLSTHDLDLALHVADRIWLIASNGEFSADVPEALALNGAITRTFQNEGVAFNISDGRFNLCLPQHASAYIEGTGPAALWARRALERLGFRLVNANRSSEVDVYLHLLADGQWQLQTRTGVETLPHLGAVVQRLENMGKA